MTKNDYLSIIQDNDIAQLLRHELNLCNVYLNADHDAKPLPKPNQYSHEYYYLVKDGRTVIYRYQDNDGSRLTIDYAWIRSIKPTSLQSITSLADYLKNILSIDNYTFGYNASWACLCEK